MSDAPDLLLAHHLKALKLPTFLREHDKLARQCAAEGVDHVRYLLRLAELEPNAIERVWQHLRDRYLSGRSFRNTRAIVDACCEAWNALTAEAGRMRSLTNYEWARPVRT